MNRKPTEAKVPPILLNIDNVLTTCFVILLIFKKKETFLGLAIVDKQSGDSFNGMKFRGKYRFNKGIPVNIVSSKVFIRVLSTIITITVND